MNRIAARINWISAVASLAMMLAVQTLHSPLHHAVEAFQIAAAAPTQPVLQAGPAEASTPNSTCSHSHSHRHNSGHSHGHVHTELSGHTHSHAVVHGGCDLHQHSHGDAHDCHLCQFLTQSVAAPAMPVLLTGEEAVSARPVDFAPEVILVSLTAPHVRGPPHIS